METAVQTRQAPVEATGLPLVVRLGPVIELSEDQFFEFCQINRELRIERNVRGELLIMPPAGSETGGRNAGITAQLWLWANRDGTGLAFDSSAGFTLPNGAVRSPDASWIARSRWEQVPTERRDKFAPICPDFVLELRSPSDTLRDLQAKTVEYLANGARLGWLLDPPTRHVYVYRRAADVGDPRSALVPTSSGAAVERLEDPETVSGDPVLPGFVLNVREVW